MMSIEQAVGALCTHLEAERASLEQLYYLLEHELEALKALNRERLNELNAYKLQILQSHQELLTARSYYLSPFTPPQESRLHSLIFPIILRQNLVLTYNLTVKH